MALVRSRRSLERIKSAYASGNTEKKLRSYMIPEYQRHIIDMLESETGESKAGIVRGIIDEWIEMQLREANGQ